MKNSIITVKLWGMEVGRLRWDERKGNSIFAYNPKFRESGLDIAPLTHSIHSPSALNPIWGNKSERIYHCLPPFIADSLPDNWGNKVFEQWALQQGIKRHELTPLEKLAYIGKRGMGALEFEPEYNIEDSSDSLKMKQLSDLAEKIYMQREELSIMNDENLTIQSLFEIGTSAGGRQAKAIIAINEETGEIRSGQTTSDKAYRHYILKFDMPFDYAHPATLLEMVYYELAKEAGIRIMPSKLLKIENKRHFLTERFDRKEGNKVHIQTLAAVNPLADSYEDLIKTARRLGVDKAEINILMRQIVFNVLAGNTDDHNKNFSFIMDMDGKWHIAPAYDLTFTARSPHEKFPHCFSLRGKTDGITEDDLLYFAESEGIPNGRKIISEVGSSICRFREKCLKYGIANYWTDLIEETLWELASEENKPKLSGWKKASVIEVEGLEFHNTKLELAEKGNLHLLASCQGKEYKYIIRKETEAFEYAEEVRLNGSEKEAMKTLLTMYLLPKVL